MNHIYVHFIRQGFVRNTLSSRAQETNQSIAKNLIKTEVPKRLLMSINSHFLLSKQSKLSEYSEEEFFLPFISSFTFTSGAYKIKVVIERKMSSIRYTNQRKTQCVIWMGEGHREAPVQRKFFTHFV